MLKTEQVIEEPTPASEISPPAPILLPTELLPPAPAVTGGLGLDQEPVLEITSPPAWRNARMTRPERAMLKSAVGIIAAHQEPVPYRELLNQVYMELVDKKIDFDSARQIETTLVNHNGRELLLVEEKNEADDKIVRKWLLGEKKLAPEKRMRMPSIRKITSAKPKLPSIRFPFRRSRKSRYVEKETDDTSADA